MRTAMLGFHAVLSPVPVIELNVDSQLLQGDVGAVPEGNLHHLSDQLLQLALQLLDDRQVICVLCILALKLLQIVFYRLVQWGCTVIYLKPTKRHTRSRQSSQRRWEFTTQLYWSERPGVPVAAMGHLCFDILDPFSSPSYQLLNPSYCAVSMAQRIRQPIHSITSLAVPIETDSYASTEGETKGKGVERGVMRRREKDRAENERVWGR